MEPDDNTEDIFQTSDGQFTIAILNKVTIDASKPDDKGVHSIGLIIYSKDLKLELDLNYPTVRALITELREQIGAAKALNRDRCADEECSCQGLALGRLAELVQNHQAG